MPSPVSYAFEPGTTVYVLYPRTCDDTYYVKQANVSRVEVSVSQALPTDIVTTSYVVNVIGDNQIKTFDATDVFVDAPTAVTEATARYVASLA